MDFKDRFKGRTTLIKKEGVIDTFTDSNNPVKSYSNSQLPKETPSNTQDFQTPDVTKLRQSHQTPLENKSNLPAYHPHVYSRSPDSHSHAKPPRAPGGTTYNQDAGKPLYTVGNPLPSLDVAETQIYGNMGAPYPRFNSVNQRNIYQDLPPNDFNPNNFYNQHSQFKSNTVAQTPKDRNVCPNNGPSTNEMHKRNFENMSQQHKHKRMAEEALRGFENQNLSHRMPSNNSRYEENSQIASYYNSHAKPPLPNQGYGYREIHGNPGSYQHTGANDNGFNYFPGNYTYQADNRRRQYDDGNSVYYGEIGHQSKTSYKPYSLREYKDLKKNSVQLGGLGPNINTEEWQKEREKRDKMLEFAQNVKAYNANRITGNENNFKVKKETSKEKSKRDVGLDFARNIAKPKGLRRNSSPTNSSNLQINKTQSDKTRHYGGSTNSIDDFEQRHMRYLDQVEKMKFS